VAESAVGALQIGRRSMIVCGALVVAPTSTVYTPQELAGKPVALDYGNGTAYAGLLMLEGAMPRAAITTRAATTHGGERLDAVLRGDVEATVLQEPWITVAEKLGCRLVSTTFFHGTWVAHPGVSAEAYAAFLRAVTRAVRRINADKRRYASYFLRDFPDDPRVAALAPGDFNLHRLQLKEPGPIPEHEARWAWDWMASWGLIEGAFDAAAQINRGVERDAHAHAGVGAG
jgi:ABC-type nitrate/sulfonate/bicarbonate transport system substrate-binding protein